MLTEDADERLRSVQEMYRQHGVGLRVGFGRFPAVLIIDYQQSYTRTWRAASLEPVRATARLLAIARDRGLPVVFTYVGYDPEHPDAGTWGLKAKTLVENIRGSEACRIDPLVEPLPAERVMEKRVPSAFFGSDLADWLGIRGIDTVVVCGTSTSGCVRATVVDALSHGFRVIVPRECVNDPSGPSGQVALVDIDTKYGDVMGLDEVIDALEAVPGSAAGSSE